MEVLNQLKTVLFSSNLVRQTVVNFANADNGGSVTRDQARVPDGRSHPAPGHALHASA
jgi:hypothetical protein